MQSGTIKVSVLLICLFRRMYQLVAATFCRSAVLPVQVLMQAWHSAAAKNSGRRCQVFRLCRPARLDVMPFLS